MEIVMSAVYNNLKIETKKFSNNKSFKLIRVKDKIITIILSKKFKQKV